MNHKYKVSGMSSPSSFTCQTEDGNIFWAKSGLDKDRYDALFKWAKSDDEFWKQNITGEIEYESLGVGNTPINGVLKSLTIS